MSNEWTFTTKVDASCYNLAKAFGLPELDVETDALPIVEWNIEWEARERGLKAAYISVTNVRCTLEWWVSDDELTAAEIEKLTHWGGIQQRNGTIAGSIEVSKSDGWLTKDWEYKVAFGFKEDGGCMPESVEIDFSTNQISIE